MRINKNQDEKREEELGMSSEGEGGWRERDGIQG